MGAYRKLPGEEREHVGAFSVECPECGAPPGFACRKPEGKGQYDSHKARRHLVSRTGVAVMELAVLFSAFDAVTDVALLEEGAVPAEELPGIPDPGELFAKGEEMTTAEGVAILRGFLDMSAEGEARLWQLLNLSAEGSD